MRRLKPGLTHALGQLLPADATTVSNLHFDGRPDSLGATFYPRSTVEGTPLFSAPVRINLGPRSGNLEIDLIRHSTIPAGDGCPDPVRLADMASKGLTVDCGRTTVDGTVVFTPRGSDRSPPG